ncbi:MAG TPA: hypothetical protein VFU71_20590 [Burkholderiaceae bacterium]|nr:hypothetical protein [Burkholderiaceae bacterium]
MRMNAEFADMSAVTRFCAAVRQVRDFVLLEGLPHQHWESELLATEMRAKAFVKLSGFPFYRDTLSMSSEDRQRLSHVLCDPETYSPFGGEKACGGFHPDYAVEWCPDGMVWRALICYGCGEIKLAGPATELRCDIPPSVFVQLYGILADYHKNRPGHEARKQGLAQVIAAISRSAPE